MSRDFVLKQVRNEADMLKFGAKLGLAVIEVPAAVIFLYGNLGAGKTTLARGFLQGLGHVGTVKSPTYTIVENYHLKEKDIFHFDFYRVKDMQELEFIGLADYFHAKAICLIEWPENAGALLPPVDLSCYIEPHVIGRNVKFVAHTETGKKIVKLFLNAK
jgi:tRNA threonylcarbamoyladenosine biosynthesis protein TsaE